MRNQKTWLILYSAQVQKQWMVRGKIASREVITTGGAGAGVRGLEKPDQTSLWEMKRPCRNLTLGQCKWGGVRQGGETSRKCPSPMLTNGMWSFCWWYCWELTERLLTVGTRRPAVPAMEGEPSRAKTLTSLTVLPPSSICSVTHALVQWGQQAATQPLPPPDLLLPTSQPHNWVYMAWHTHSFMMSAPNTWTIA